MKGTELLLFRALAAACVVMAVLSATAWMGDPQTEDELVKAWGFASGAGLTGLLAAVLGVVGHFEAKTRERIRQVAESMGFVFDEDGSILRGAGFLKLDAFRSLRPGSTTAFNAWRGALDGFEEVAVFNFGRGNARSTSSGGMRTTSYRCTAVAFRLPADLPVEFRLETAGFGKALAADLRGKELVEFEDSRFGEHYLGHCDEPDKLGPLLNREFRDALIADPDWWVDGGRDWLVLWKFNREPKPEEYRRYIEDARRLALTFRPADNE